MKKACCRLNAFTPGETLSVLFALLRIAARVVNVDDLPYNVLIVRAEVRRVHSSVRSMWEMMIVIGIRANRYLVLVRVETIETVRRVRRRRRGEERVPSQKAAQEQRHLRQQQGLLGNDQQEAEHERYQ